tara:strand:+ start:517 stop:747 length:231 start_codon:yes stop_codon:yes gene_type:complete
MIYDYNPITGLNYYTSERERFCIDFYMVPNNKTTEELLDEWRILIRETGIQLVNSAEEEPAVTPIPDPILTNGWVL